MRRNKNRVTVLGAGHTDFDLKAVVVAASKVSPTTKWLVEIGPTL
jgi:hypothetical protein